METNSLNRQKSHWQKCREAAGLTRRQACEQLGFITENRLEKIEKGKTAVQPAEILAMEKVYHAPTLASHYCRHCCAIGARDIVPVIDRSLDESITLALYVSAKLERNRLELLERAVQESSACPEDLLKETARLLSLAASAGQSLDLLLRQKKKDGKL